MFVAGDYRGDIWLFWDITQRKRLEERRERELATVEEARRAAEEDRQRLAAHNAHLREVTSSRPSSLPPCRTSCGGR